MLPSATMNDAKNGAVLDDAEFSGELSRTDFASRILLSDGSHYRVSQLCFALSGSFDLPPVRNSVSCVLQTSSPRKVADVIVGRATIEMPTFHSVRAWANESLQNKSMHKPLDVSFSSGNDESGSQIAAFPLIQFETVLLTKRSARPYGSIVADLIAWVSGDVSVSDCRIRLSHDSHLAIGGGCG
jgi:hypothetical protein